MTTKQKVMLDKLGLTPVDLFKPLHEIQDALLQKAGVAVDLSEELAALGSLYASMSQKAMEVDPTLSQHTQAIGTAASRKADRLVAKMKTAQRKKLATQTAQIQKLKEKLFPNNSLQERTENIAGFYATYGDQIFDWIKDYSRGLLQQFGVIYLPAPIKQDADANSASE